MYSSKVEKQLLYQPTNFISFKSPALYLKKAKNNYSLNNTGLSSNKSSKKSAFSPSKVNEIKTKKEVSYLKYKTNKNSRKNNFNFF